MVYVKKCYQAILASIQNSKSLSKQYVLGKNGTLGHLVFSLQTSLSREFYHFIIEILVNTADQQTVAIEAGPPRLHPESSISKG